MYLLNMNFISSDKVRRMNAFTILVLLSKLPTHLLLANFDELMKHVVFEVKSEKFKNSKVQPVKFGMAFKDVENYSKRKGLLREKQLYQDMQLDVFFKAQIGVSLKDVFTKTDQ